MLFTRFADVVTLSTTRTADPLAARIERFVGLEHIEPENLHIRSWGNVADGITFTSTFKRGQVLFGKRRAYQGKVAIAEFDGVCSSDIYVFESKDPNVLLPELLPFVCQSEGFYQYAIKTSAGSLSPRTNWTHLANYEFPLPPVDEQRRIADLLWATEDSSLQHLSLYQGELQLLQATINHLTMCGVDLDGGIRNKSAKVCDNGDEQLRNHPDSWKVFRMKDLVGFMLSGLSRAITNEDIGIPVITSTNIVNGQLDTSNLKYWYVDDPQGAQTSNYILDDGDILLNFINSVAQIGKSCMFRDIGRPAIYTTNIFRIKPSDLITNEYLMWLLRSSYIQKWFIKITKPAINQASFTKQDFYRIPISIPDISEQKRITFVLSEIDETLRATSKHIAHLKNVKKIMLDSFLGTPTLG